MNVKKAKEVYNNIKERQKGKTEYKEEIHCPMVLEVIGTNARVSAFCIKAEISDTKFHQWLVEYPIFNECYRLGKMIALEAWEEEGINGRYNPEFNVRIWERQGLNWFGMGNQNKLRILIDTKSNPWEQFRQLLEQARTGEFTSAELKQCAETMNIGIRAHEAFKMQEEIDNLKADLELMSDINGDNVTAIDRAKKKNQNTV